MIPVRSVKQVPPWATEKAAPHFGKPSGLAPVSWKRSKIKHLISMTRDFERAVLPPHFFPHPGHADIGLQVFLGHGQDIPIDVSHLNLFGLSGLIFLADA
jgi:hypothetical protein